MAMSMFGRGIATKGSGTALKVLQNATEQNIAFKVNNYMIYSLEFLGLLHKYLARWAQIAADIR